MVCKKICEVCGKEFDAFSKTQRYCSKECFRKAPSYRAQKAHEYFLTHGEENKDFVKCPICGLRAVQFHSPHFQKFHGMTKEEVKKKFPDFKWTCDNFIENNLSGENNPSHSSKVDYSERQKRTPFSIEFYRKKYDSEEKAQKAYDEFIEFHSQNQKKIDSVMYIKHWTNLGYSKEEARKKVREKCVSNGIDYYIKRYGEIEGPEKYYQRMEKWEKSIHGKMPGSVYSNMSFEFFTEIVKDREDRERFMFGAKEKIIKDEETHSFFYPVDFFDTVSNKIIEFNGDYWHANPEMFEADDVLSLSRNQIAKNIREKDNIKIQNLEKKGYKVLVIWEREWTKDKKGTIQKCKDFLFKDEKQFKKDEEKRNEVEELF